MEDSTNPSIRASFKKWGYCRCTPSKKPRPLLQARALKKYKKKCYKKNKIEKNVPLVAWRVVGGRPAVADRPAAPDQRLPAGGEPAVGDRWSGCSWRPLTTSCRPCPSGSPIFVTPYLLSSSLLPPIFFVVGQLFLIGYSTCLPCPDFY
jgi:hypothetical protein